MPTRSEPEDSQPPAPQSLRIETQNSEPAGVLLRHDPKTLRNSARWKFCIGDCHSRLPRQLHSLIALRLQSVAGKASSLSINNIHPATACFALNPFAPRGSLVRALGPSLLAAVWRLPRDGHHRTRYWGWLERGRHDPRFINQGAA